MSFAHGTYTHSAEADVARASKQKRETMKHCARPIDALLRAQVSGQSIDVA
jgi:hypothetical protein